LRPASWLRYKKIMVFGSRSSSLVVVALGVSLSALAGCTNTPPIVAEGGWLVSFLDTGNDCNLVTHNTELGSVDNADIRQLLKDGEQEGQYAAKVECSVTGDGTFNVSGSAKTAEKSLRITVNGLSDAATQAAPVTGSVSYSSATKTAGNPFSSQACDFYLTDDQRGQTASGKTWLSFACETLSGPMNTCGISVGYAAFENCN
jgi:hypothetical protein